MNSLRQILVAVDYSSASERALEIAAVLATQCGAAITVLHVIEEAVFPISDEARQAARSRLDETVAALRARMFDASSLLREGAAVAEICSSAAELDAGLVVIGSRGRRGLPRFVLGSVAERVVAMSPVPVLTVHPSDAVSILVGGMGRIRHIVAPTDFSEASQRGVDAAVTVALELDAALTIVHVRELPSYAYGLEGLIAEEEAKVRRALDEALAHVRVRLPRADGVARAGAPWKRILDVVEERRADLIVMRTHGRHGLQRMLIGSVAEKIVRLSPVPVLTLGVNGEDLPLPVAGY
jgi:nucleotide-binding universal stress UspA family protein